MSSSIVSIGDSLQNGRGLRRRPTVSEPNAGAVPAEQQPAIVMYRRMPLQRRRNGACFQNVSRSIRCTRV